MHTMERIHWVKTPNEFIEKRVEILFFLNRDITNLTLGLARIHSHTHIHIHPVVAHVNQIVLK